MLVIIGAGTGLYQVLDVLCQQGTTVQPVVVDGDPSKAGQQIAGLDIIGGEDDLRIWHEQHPDYQAIISIGDPGPRAQWRAFCESIGMGLVSFVDGSARHGLHSKIGDGCLISAFCHVGAYAEVGRNCKLSPYCSIEHHAVVGDDCTFGPGVITSGCVHIGSRCKFGTGIFIEPHVSIGDDCIIASGAVLTSSVPAGHIVRTKVNTSVAEPVRK